MKPNVRAQWPDAPNIPDGPATPAPGPLEKYKAELSAALEEVKQHNLIQLEEIKQQDLVVLESIKQANTIELAKYNAEIAKAAAQQVSTDAARTADYAFFHGVLAEHYKSYLEVAKGSSDRSMTRMQRTQEAAVAIGTLYTGILAFLAVTGSTDKTKSSLAVLEPQAMIPTIFLGAAVVLSTAYVSYLAPLGTSKDEAGDGTFQGDLDVERNNFIRWATKVPRWRIAIAQLAVVALGLGVVFFPIGFIENISTERAARIAAITTVVVLTIWFLLWRLAFNDQETVSLDKRKSK